MKLSFVIPAYNEEDYIGDCLASIEREKKMAPCEVEIVVADNASTDRTAEIARRYPDVLVVHEPQKGIVHARRAGYLAATGDLIANVDADSRLTPGWIVKVHDEFARDPKLVCLSGPFTYFDASPWVNFVAKEYSYVMLGLYAINRFVLRMGSMIQGGNFVVTRNAIEKIGGYDTTITFYGEDADLARRLNAVGHAKFTLGLPMYSSARRYQKEGYVATSSRYALNYFWTMIFKRPFTKNYLDIRPKEGNNTRAEKTI